MAIPVLTAGQMLAWEAASWAAGLRETDVIARVGERVAGKVRELTPAGARVLLLAGRGHNGDDVRAALPHLADREAKLLNAFNPAHALADLALNLAPPRRPALVVDGLFGTGLDRDLSPEWVQLIAAINAAGVPVLAVDLPSGLNADTGRPRGAAVRAMVTLTVGAPKQGLLDEAAWEHVGRLEVATEVGLLPDPEAVLRRERSEGWKFSTMWTMPEDFAGFPPARPVAAHKGTLGHVVLLAGSLGYHGAAVLAARAAGGARPGLVTVLTSPETYVPVASQLSAPMVRPWREPLELPAKTTALLVGPGLAGPDVPDWLREQVVTWWRELPCALIADASALDWLAEAGRRAKDDGLPKRPAASEPGWPVSSRPLRVITPHPGEAARMVGLAATQTGLGRSALLRAAGRAAGGCWVVLKGHQTLVGDGGEPESVNPTGNPGLAQGGSGDVLAGFLAGLLAQPEPARDPLRTIRYAVWEHGRAADRLEAHRRNWTAADLAAAVGGEAA